MRITLYILRDKIQSSEKIREPTKSKSQRFENLKICSHRLEINISRDREVSEEIEAGENLFQRCAESISN